MTLRVTRFLFADATRGRFFPDETARTVNGRTFIASDDWRRTRRQSPADPRAALFAQRMALSVAQPGARFVSGVNPVREAARRALPAGFVGFRPYPSTPLYAIAPALLPASLALGPTLPAVTP